MGQSTIIPGGILDKVRRWRSDSLLVYASILLPPLILLSPVYMTGKALFWGTPLLQFVPWWTFAWQSLLEGHLPLWNPYVGMGAPLLANYQSALFYPPNWTYFLAYLLGGVKALAWWQAPMLALHLAWAGLGMARLVRRLGLGVLAQSITGLAFGLSGYLVARASFLSINAAVAWLPWVILCLTPKVRAVQASSPSTADLSRPNLALVACLAMQLLAGHAQTTWYTLLLAVLWIGFWQWNGYRQEGFRVEPEAKQNVPWPLRFKPFIAPFIWFVVALVIAVGIAALQLLPTAEYLMQSQRASAVDFDFAMIYSFWPWRLLTLLAPGMFGNPATGNYWGYANYWEDALYIGLLPLLLAFGVVIGLAWHGLRRWVLPKSVGANQGGGLIRPYKGMVVFACVVGAIGLLLAFGNNTLIFPWLYRNVPTFDMFQAPARWLIWVEFSLALLAGLGAERWRRPVGWGLYWTRLGTAGALSITLGAGYTWALMGAVSPSFIRATATLGLWGIVAGLLSLAAPPIKRDLPGEDSLPPGKVKADERRLQESDLVAVPGSGAKKAGSGLRKRLFQFAPPVQSQNRPGRPYPLRLWQWAVTLFVATDLLVAGWGLNPAGDLALYGPAEGVETLRDQLAGHRLYFPPKQEYWFKYVRFLQFDTFNPGDNWNDMRTAMLANANILDGIPSVNNFDPLTPGRYTDWLDLLAEVTPATQQELLLLMDVGVVQTLHRQKLYGLGLQALDEGARLRWVPCPRYAIDAAHARQQVASGGLNIQEEVILETGFIAEAVECSPEARATYVVMKSNGKQNPNQLVAEFEAGEGGWLVVSDVWYPGWRAWVDGVETQILHANYLFRAVELTPGNHQVVFAYRPLSFYAGVVISLVTLFITLAWWRYRVSAGVQGDPVSSHKETG
jgi:hypothetical protein